MRFDKIEGSDRHEGQDGVIEATSHWIDKHGEFLLEEKRTMTFGGEPSEGVWGIDLIIDLTAQREVVFEDIEEGVLGIRLSDYLRETNTGVRPSKDAEIPKEDVLERGVTSAARGRKRPRISGASVIGGLRFRGCATARLRVWRCSIILTASITRRTGMCATTDYCRLTRWGRATFSASRRIERIPSSRSG